MDMLRTSCVIGAIVFALPMPHGDKLSAMLGSSPNPQFMTRVSQNFSDLASLCNVQPKACDTAEFIVESVKAKAQYSAQLLIEWADEATSTGNDMVTSIQAYADTIQTGSTLALVEAALRGPLYPDEG